MNYYRCQKCQTDMGEWFDEPHLCAVCESQVIPASVEPGPLRQAFANGYAMALWDRRLASMGHVVNPTDR